jgi:hypothetical protein
MTEETRSVEIDTGVDDVANRARELATLATPRRPIRPACPTSATSRA